MFCLTISVEGNGRAGRGDVIEDLDKKRLWMLSFCYGPYRVPSEPVALCPEERVSGREIVRKRERGGGEREDSFLSFPIFIVPLKRFRPSFC